MYILQSNYKKHFVSLYHLNKFYYNLTNFTYSMLMSQERMIEYYMIGNYLVDFMYILLNDYRKHFVFLFLLHKLRYNFPSFMYSMLMYLVYMIEYYMIGNYLAGFMYSLLNINTIRFLLVYLNRNSRYNFTSFKTSMDLL